MKLFISILLTALTGFSNLSIANLNVLHNEPYNESSEFSGPRRTKFSVKFLGEIGRPDKDCKGIGTGCLGLDINIVIEPNIPPRSANEVVFTYSSNTTMLLEFIYQEDMKGYDLIVDKDFALPQNMVKELGLRSLHIVSGTYKVSSIKNGIASVIVSIK